MHGGVKVYRGAAAAARALRGGRPLPRGRLLPGRGHRRRRALRRHPGRRRRSRAPLDGDAYEAWVAGLDLETGAPKGRLRTTRRRCGSSRSWSTGRRPGRWPPRCTRTSRPRYDAAQDRAAEQIIGWLAEHATTRVGPRGRQVQVPVERDRGGGGAALHLPGRRPAPASAPADQRPGVRRRRAGAGCTRSGCATASTRSTASGTPR